VRGYVVGAELEAAFLFPRLSVGLPDQNGTK